MHVGDVLVQAASGVAIYGAFVATVAFLIGGASLVWNIVNATNERKARRRPEVHATVAITPGKNSELHFGNAGPALARQIQFLLVESGFTIHGGVGTAFLAADEKATVPLPFASTAARSTFVWAYMDADHNVHARSNNGDYGFYEHPTRVGIDDIFRRFYPDVPIPVPHHPFGILGES